MNAHADREISLLVSVHVEHQESDKQVLLRLARRAARQAIRNALWDREESGFDHEQDGLTVTLAGIELLPQTTRIIRKPK
jgi:hypothetical protein